MLSVLQTVVTSSLVAALVTAGITALREHRKRRTAARLAALHAINVIEDYVNTCMETLDELDTSDYVLGVIDGDGPIESRFRLVPQFPDFPSNVDWLALGVEASRRIKNYRSEANSKRGAASLRWSPYLPDAFAKVRQYTARLALDGTRLVVALRAEWKLEGFYSELVVGDEAEAVRRHNAYAAERQAIHDRTTMQAD